MASKFKRGDIVSYKGELYFFQPNGTQCYLYEYYDEVGFWIMAKHKPSRKSVVKPDPIQAKEYSLTHKRRPGRSTFRPYHLDELDCEDVLELSDSSDSSHID